MKTPGAKGGGGRPSETQQLQTRGDQVPPPVPDDLRGDYARRLWELAITELPHVLRPVDEPVLRLAAVSYQLAMDSLAANEHKTFVSAVTKFDALAKQVGLNPHCRRVIKPCAENQGDDPLEQWIAAGGLGRG